jgi:hypothetical protein
VRPRPVAAGAIDRAQLSPRVIGALDTRRSALAEGIDPDVRPADVAAIAAVRPPVWRGTLSAKEAEHAQSLVREALKDLDVRVHTNVQSSYAATALRRGGRLGNLYDLVEVPVAERPPLVASLEHAVSLRATAELTHGFYGTGTTVYGTVHFSDVTHTPQIDHRKTLRYRGRELDVGAMRYGDASIVLGERAVRNATFLPADTGQLAGRRPLRAKEHLADVVFEWLVDNFQLGTPQEAARTTSTVFGGDRSPRAIARDFRAILAMPRPKAVAAIREHLTSAAINDNYIEAQVRIATVDDIRAIHLVEVDPSYIPPEERARFQAALDALRNEAKARSIPLRSTRDPLPAHH